MLSRKMNKLNRRLVLLGIMVFMLVALSLQPTGKTARAYDSCCDDCTLPWDDCSMNCLDVWCPGPSCNQPMYAHCREMCEQAYHNCQNQCGDDCD